MPKAKDVMTTQLTTVMEETAMQHVIKLLVDHNITGIPVVNEDMELKGIITEKDVLKMLMDRASSQTTVKSIMTTDVVSFDESDNLMEIFKAFVDNSFRRVPILSDGRLAGIISRKDIIKYIFEKSSRSDS